MISKLTRLRGRSLEEISVRTAQAVCAQLERLQLLLPVSRRSSAILSNNRIAPSLTTRPTFKSLQGNSKLPCEIAQRIAVMDSQALDIFRHQAKALAEGRITLLGLDELTVGNPPNWHRDATSGLIAPMAHWSKIPYLDHSVIGDHKVLWEVNRHQYLFAPTMCWLVDHEIKHFELIQQHLDSWLEQNPPRMGVNWASSLEVAYRAITWCWLLWLLRDAPWKNELLNRVYGSLEAHALHVERYLSLYFSPNTHLTGEALGLFYIGTVLPESRHATRWRKRGAAILESWLDRHVHDDGVYFEQASQYHRYTTEIYLHYLLLSESSGWLVSSRVRRALHRLFDVLRSMTSNTGEMPLIGDDDGGLLLPIDHRAPEQLNGLLLLGATALNRPDLMLSGAPNPALSYWLCGTAATDRMLAAPPANPTWKDMYFASGGMAILRDGWDAAAAVAVVDAAPHGAMNCGHAHADALSLCLSLGGIPLFIDRGTLTYVGAERSEFRSTASHNTLEIDGQSSVTPLGPFQWDSHPPRPTAVVRTSDLLTVFDGIATGHVDSERPSRHRRIILHMPGSVWIVLDQGTREGAAHASCRWQLHPNLTATKRTPRVFDIQDQHNRLVATVAAPLSSGFTAIRRDVSLRFGHRAAATLLQAGADQDLRILTLMLPAISTDQPARFETLKCDQARGWQWDDTLGSHSVMAHCGKHSPVELAGWRSEADLLWHVQFSQPIAGTTELLVAVNPRLLNAPPDVAFAGVGKLTTDRIVVLTRTATGWAQPILNEPRRGQE